MSKPEVWWVVVVNFGGVNEPVRCYKPAQYDKNILWDDTGEYDCDKRAGIWPVGHAGSHCSQFQIFRFGD